MPSSVRFNAKTEARLKRAALRRGVSKSDYVRAAVDEKLDREERAVSSWDLAKDLCGVLAGTDPDISQRDPGEIIREKHRRIRERYERRSR